MKVKNSYLKLMLWTLSGAAIGAVLGAGSIMFAKRGAVSLAELLYAGAVRSALWIQLIVWLVLGGCSLVLMNKAKKWSPLMDSDEEGVTEKKGRQRSEYCFDSYQCQFGLGKRAVMKRNGCRFTAAATRHFR